MNPPPEYPPPPLPATATQGGEPVTRKVPAERAVWTERMLTALVTGLKGNRWFSLIDKIYRDETLRLAWKKVQSNAGGSGVDGITVDRFNKNCSSGLLVLKEQLQEAAYLPKSVKRVWIPKQRFPVRTWLQNQKWRNHYFAKRGLFSLTQAHAEACRSP